MNNWKSKTETKTKKKQNFFFVFGPVSGGSAGRPRYGGAREGRRVTFLAGERHSTGPSGNVT